jgi:Uma2 family endonuclease
LGDLTVMSAILLNLKPTVEMTDEQFEEICRHNPELRLERTAKGELIAMSPTGSETGRRSSNLNGQLWVWNQHSRLGKTFDSSTGFKLPNGATRSPDAAWVEQSRWEALTPEERRKFAPICPDFVVELCSPSDEQEDLRAKMQEYLENGLRLGWLIEPSTQQVEIYRPNQSVEVLQNPVTVSGELVLPGFELDLTEIWVS